MYNNSISGNVQRSSNDNNNNDFNKIEMKFRE